MGTAWLKWIGLALVLGGASCSQPPEEFCQDWGEASCQAISGCCQGEATFDMAQCRLRLSLTCLGLTDVDVVHSGQAVFDSDAASACYPRLACELTADATDMGFERQKACGNMLTGHLPLGSSCSGDMDCARSGEFSQCYRGQVDVGGGVCAAVVLDDERCSFSFDDNTLHVCPDDKFCDLDAAKDDPKASPTELQYVFSAPCRARIAPRESCVDAKSHSVLSCQAGFYCDVTGSDVGRCEKQKSAGAACNPHSPILECADGLRCGADESNPETCARFTPFAPFETFPLFCVAP